MWLDLYKQSSSSTVEQNSIIVQPEEKKSIRHLLSDFNEDKEDL